MFNVRRFQGARFPCPILLDECSKTQGESALHPELVVAATGLTKCDIELGVCLGVVAQPHERHRTHVVSVGKNRSDLELIRVLKHELRLFEPFVVVGAQVQCPTEARAERTSSKWVTQVGGELRNVPRVSKRPDGALPKLHEELLLRHPDKLVSIRVRGHLLEHGKQPWRLV